MSIILGHWGELVLYYVDRLMAIDRVSGLQKNLEVYIRCNVFLEASGMFSFEHQRRALGIVGSEWLLFSTDYPYQYRPGGNARAFLDTCGLEGRELDDFASGNWLRLTAGILR